MKTRGRKLLKACFIVGIVGLSVAVSPRAHAKDSASGQFDFQRIWSMVIKSDPALRAAQEELQAATISADRSARHWYPRIYATGKAFSTNDPATSFMFALEQRQIGAADFVPSSLNQPGSSFFQQGSLGVDLPLFEGGSRVAQAQAAEKGALAKRWEAKAQSILEYARLVENYAGLLALIEERKQLFELRSSIQGVMERYSIGSKSNPVGYSGLLGLKNLINRVEGLLAQNEASAQAKRAQIHSVAQDLPSSWQPKPNRAGDFLSGAFPNPSSTDAVPASVHAMRLVAESMDSAKSGERARFLPRIGAFAQGDLYNGSRSSATSYTAGAYLQWDLFSATNFGAIRQATHQSAAAEARADQLAAKVKSDSMATEAGLVAAEKTLKLLDESADLLFEQTKVARQLFQNGSINALQLVEVLNRRADLLGNRRDAELALAQSKAALFQLTSSEGVSQ